MAESADSVAIGTGAIAQDGAAVAIGLGNQASGNGSVAIGDPNFATGEGAVAVGKDNMATGNGAIALGDTSSAVGLSAIAAGQRANASANNAIALGNAAVASAAGSVAIGPGAEASRADQMALGGARSTYTLRGINSEASRLAQQGALRLVTADGLGNLGTAAFDFGQLDRLNQRVGVMEDRITAFAAQLAQTNNNMQQAERRANAGIAAAMALGGTVMPADMKVSVSFNLATFRGQQGFSGAAVARVSDHVWLSGGVAGSTQRGSTGGRVGVTFGW